MLIEYVLPYRVQQMLIEYVLPYRDQQMLIEYASVEVQFGYDSWRELYDSVLFNVLTSSVESQQWIRS